MAKESGVWRADSVLAPGTFASAHQRFAVGGNGQTSRSIPAEGSKTSSGGKLLRSGRLQPAGFSIVGAGTLAPDVYGLTLRTRSFVNFHLTVFNC